MLYEKAFLEVITFQKTVLSFSSNVEEDVIRHIKGILGIFVVFRRSRYLGLPTSIYHN